MKLVLLHLYYILLLHLYVLAECTAMQSLAFLPEDCALYCSCTQSKLEEIWGQMLDGKIPVFDLQKVSRHQQHMENLCSAVFNGIDVKDTRRKQQWSTETVHNVIQQRVKELSAIHDYRDKLKYLCTVVPYTTGNVHATLTCTSMRIICYRSQKFLYNIYMCTIT